MALRNTRILMFALPIVAAVLLAMFALPKSIQAASLAPQRPAVSLNQLTYRSFTLTDVNTNGKKITGQLDTGGRNPQGWVDGVYKVTEAQYVGFYGNDADLKQYLVDGSYTIPVNVYVEAITPFNSTDISLELGSPIPGSLNEGGGSTLAGKYQPNGSIIGAPNQFSPDDNWTAIPVR